MPRCHDATMRKPTINKRDDRSICDSVSSKTGFYGHKTNPFTAHLSSSQRQPSFYPVLTQNSLLAVGPDNTHRIPSSTTRSHLSEAESLSSKHRKPCGNPTNRLTSTGTLHFVSQSSPHIRNDLPSFAQHLRIQNSLISQRIQPSYTDHTRRHTLHLFRRRIAGVDFQIVYIWAFDLEKACEPSELGE